MKGLYRAIAQGIFMVTLFVKIFASCKLSTETATYMILLALWIYIVHGTDIAEL